MKLSSFKKITFVAMALLLLPIVACAEEAPPPPPPPQRPQLGPPGGTITVNPPKIDYNTIYASWPAVGAAIGFPEAAIAALNPAISLLGIPITFTGSGWPADDLITIDLCIPDGVDMKGLDRARGEDSIGIATGTADASGNFEATMSSIAKINWLMRADWKPEIAADWATVNPIDNGMYVVKAMGLHPDTYAFGTWGLELNQPEGWEPPAPPE